MYLAIGFYVNCSTDILTLQVASVCSIAITVPPIHDFNPILQMDHSECPNLLPSSIFSGLKEKHSVSSQKLPFIKINLWIVLSYPKTPHIFITSFMIEDTLANLASKLSNAFLPFQLS
jgi:hypothetical protein